MIIALRNSYTRFQQAEIPRRVNKKRGKGLGKRKVYYKKDCGNGGRTVSAPSAEVYSSYKGYRFGTRERMAGSKKKLPGILAIADRVFFGGRFLSFGERRKGIILGRKPSVGEGRRLADQLWPLWGERFYAGKGKRGTSEHSQVTPNGIMIVRIKLEVTIAQGCPIDREERPRGFYQEKRKR